jgi:hypothetical protein
MTMKNNLVVSNGISSQIRLFTEEESLQITDWAIRYGEGNPGLIHSRTDAARTQLRRCREYLIDSDKITFADGASVTSRVAEAFSLGNIWGLEYSSIPSIRVMEYQARDGYGPHTDWSNGAAKERKISMTCQLSSTAHYDGGRVLLYAGPDSESISQERGMATMWPSWTLHEVCPIARGVRYSLTAWAHGEPYR